MNILLIGGAGSLTNQMILKLRKEGHRVFVLTGDRSIYFQSDEYSGCTYKDKEG